MTKKHDNDDTRATDEPKVGLVRITSFLGFRRLPGDERDSKAYMRLTGEDLPERDWTPTNKCFTLSVTLAASINVLL